MGCLSRIGCLVVVAAAGAVGYWVYGDQLPTELSRAAVKAADKVNDVSNGMVEKATASRDSIRAAERRIAWTTVGASGGAVASLNTRLTQRAGPAYVTLGTADVARLIASALPAQLPKSAGTLQVALVDNQLRGRTAIDLAEIAGDGTLGQLLGTVLSGRDSVHFAATVEPVQPGLAQLRVESLRIKGVIVPSRLIATALKSLRTGEYNEALADNGLALPLPKTVADVRILDGKLTLYKSPR